MIVPLKIPPGAFRNGTEYEAKGRWRDVNLVRWYEGATRPVFGLASVSTPPRSSGGVAPRDYVRSGISWVDGSGAARLAFANFESVGLAASNATIVNIALGSLTTSGDRDTAPDSFQWAVIGDNLLFCHNVDGRIWLVTNFTSPTAAALTNAPTDCWGVFVSAENFVVALGDGGDIRSVRWSDRDQITTWTQATTNQSGDFTLDTDGQILFALQMPGEFIIVTTRDVWRATYVGYPNVYAFDRIGPCSATGSHCGVEAGGVAYWMGDNSFYTYSGGIVQQLPCDVGDYLFGDRLDKEENWKVCAWHNHNFNEVWWLYQSEDSVDDIDSYVAYDYRAGTWHYGAWGGTCVVPVTGAWSPAGRAAAVGFFSPTPGDLVTNGGFDADTDWTKGAGWSIAAGVASNASGTGTALEQTLTGLTVGVSYSIIFQVTSAGGYTMTVNPGGNGISSGAGGPTARMFTFVASAASQDLEFVLASGDVEIDDVIVGPAQFMLVDHYESHVHLSTPYAETGPLEIGDGARRAHVTRVLPDEQDAGELALTFKTREYPTSTESSFGPYTADNPTDVRFSGRQFKLRAEAATAGTDWRSGVHRVDIVPGGRR